ncbi:MULTISPECIES: saccharopine dehydrogenase family protein [Halorussus]|uniref:saccharopine dehydrogenase family protein n=1 Tax=Halorussus TaxID=1070314 RepID=UPI00209F957C|nr:saccharopine dehydrogenase NADP-binding domain-containing protein [Halorussus vallis]USZ77624.1 saccharopine dehydrogenase NADP-binding domain-containing protein [Halorussus vallis]
MKVAALGGCGAMGRATSWELATNDAVDDLLIADADVDAAEEFADELPGDVDTARVDVTDHDALVEVLADADVVANALPYAFNLDVMEACLEADAHYLDLGGLYHKTQDQLELDEAFDKADLTAVLGIGASPGLTNVAAAWGASHLDRVDAVHIRTGAKGGGEGFAYSAKTILDELTMNPIVWEGGEYEELEPLSGRETYTMPDPVGEVEGFHSIHSELATMPYTFEGVETVDFRVAFSPDLVDICDVLIGLNLTSEEEIEFEGATFSPREFLDWHLDRQPKPGAVEEWKSFRVDVTGEEDGADAHYRYEVVVESRLDDWGLKATAVWTGVPMGIAAEVVGRGEALDTGAKPPEELLAPEDFVDELRERDIDIRETRVE